MAQLWVNTNLTLGQARAVRTLRRFNQTLPHLKNQMVLAKVLAVEPDRIMVDAGWHGISEVPREDVTVAHLDDEHGQQQDKTGSVLLSASSVAISRTSTSDIRVGDSLRLRLERLYTPYGDMQLAPVQQDAEQRQRAVWEELRGKFASRSLVIGRMLNDCPGGYAVGVAGFVALLPYSRAEPRVVQNLGASQYFEIVSMDNARRRLVVAPQRVRQAGSAQ